MSRILITGATGQIGRELVRLLRTAGTPVRVLVRTPEQGARLEAPGVSPAVGDFEQPDSVEAALDGIETLFLLTPADPRLVDHQGQAIEAARRAGVRAIVKLSTLGADVDSPVSLGRWHALAERHIEEAGFAYTHLRPHYFMQNTLAFAPSIAAASRFDAPMRDGRLALVDCRDVAAVAARVLTEDGHENRIYEITGSEPLSFANLATHISAAVGRTVHYADVRPSEAEKALISTGTPGWLAEALIDFYAIFSAGNASGKTDVVRDISGRAPRTFSAFAHEHAAVFATPQESTKP